MGYHSCASTSTGYEFNVAFKERMEKKGLIFSGQDESKDISPVASQFLAVFLEQRFRKERMDIIEMATKDAVLVQKCCSLACSVSGSPLLYGSAIPPRVQVAPWPAGCLAVTAALCCNSMP